MLRTMQRIVGMERKRQRAPLACEIWNTYLGKYIWDKPAKVILRLPTLQIGSKFAGWILYEH